MSHNVAFTLLKVFTHATIQLKKGNYSLLSEFLCGQGALHKGYFSVHTVVVYAIISVTVALH